MGNDATQLYNGLQVTRGNFAQFRPGVTVSELSQDTVVGYSKALANKYYGTGGLPQYFIPEGTNMNPLYTILMRNR